MSDQSPAAETAAPLVDADLRTATHAVLRHYGYTDAEVETAEATTHESAGCKLVGEEWDCTDENHEPLHPLTDLICATADTVRVAFEAVARA